MKIGDLVRPKYLLPSHYERRRIGTVARLNTGWDHSQVSVLWNKPLWFDDEGLSSEYAENLEVIGDRELFRKVEKKQMPLTKAETELIIASLQSHLLRHDPDTIIYSTLRRDISNLVKKLLESIED